MQQLKGWNIFLDRGARTIFMNNSHIALRTWGARKRTYTRKEWPPSRVSRTSLYGRGVLCSRSTIYDCMQQLKGWNIFLDRGAPTSSYEKPSHRFTDMGCEHKMMAN